MQIIQQKNRRKSFAMLVLVVFSFALCGEALAQVDVVEGKPEGGINYQLHTDKKNETSRLAIWLHPSGGSMNDNAKTLIPLLAKHGFALMIPTDKSYRSWNTDEIHKVMNISVPHAQKNKNINNEKPFLIGFSAGGQIAVIHFLEHPESIGGIVANSTFPLQMGARGFSRLAPPTGEAHKQVPFFVVLGQQERAENAWTPWNEEGYALEQHVIENAGHQWLLSGKVLKDLSNWLSVHVKGSSSTSGENQESSWLIDYDKAFLQSQQTGKDVLMLVTGIDMFGASAKFDKLLQDDKLREKLEENYVLLRIQVSGSGLSSEQKAKNSAIQMQYKVPNFPRLIFLNSDKYPYAAATYLAEKAQERLGSNDKGILFKGSASSVRRKLGRVEKARKTFKPLWEKIQESEGEARSQLLKEYIEKMEEEGVYYDADFYNRLVARVDGGQEKDANGLVWQTNYEKALKQAQDEKKLLFMNFTGSDWCQPCQALHENVFSTTEFRDMAQELFVLLELDFPRVTQIDEELQQQNQMKQRHFRVRAFPTIILLSEDSTMHCSLSGYSDESTKEYLDKIKGLVDKGYERRLLIEQAQNCTGVEKAKLLDQSLEMAAELSVGVTKEDYQAVIDADADNEAGLKEKWENNLLMNDIQTLAQTRPQEAIGKMDELITNSSGEQRVHFYLTRAYFRVLANPRGFDEMLKDVDLAQEYSEKTVNLLSLRPMVMRINQFYAQQRKNGKVIKMSKEWIKRDPTHGEAYYWLGCSQASNKKLVDQALDNIEKAIQNGFDHLDVIKNDARLRAIRENPRFITLVSGT